MLNAEMTEAEAFAVTQRVNDQRSIREVDLREPDPPAPQFRYGMPGGWYFQCFCGAQVQARTREGNCHSCGRGFDLTAWGR